MRCALPTVAATATLALLLAACSSRNDSATSDDSLNGQPSSSSLFAPATKRVVIEIDYERGAAPFVGPTGTFHDTWAIFRDNAKAILGDGKELVVPTQLSDMQALD